MLKILTAVSLTLLISSCGIKNNNFSDSENSYLNQLDLKDNIYNQLKSEEKIKLGKSVCKMLDKEASVEEILKSSKQFSDKFFKGQMSSDLFELYKKVTVIAPSTLCTEHIKSLKDYQKLIN